MQKKDEALADFKEETQKKDEAFKEGMQKKEQEVQYRILKPTSHIREAMRRRMRRRLSLPQRMM